MGSNRYKKPKPKKPSVRWRHWIPWGAKGLAALAFILCLSVALIFMHDAVTQSSGLAIRQVTVIGIHRLSPEQIYEQARVGEGMNILAVNVTLMRKRLRAHPWIADAQVRRDLPDGIAIRVWEHNPIAILDMGKRYLMNTQGEIFKQWTLADPSDLPLVQGLSWIDLPLTGDPRRRAFEAVMTLLSMGRERGGFITNADIEELRVDGDLGITVHAFDRLGAIRLGYDRYPEKYQQLKRLYTYLHTSDPEMELDWVDLRNPQRMVIHPKHSAVDRDVDRKDHQNQGEV